MNAHDPSEEEIFAEAMRHPTPTDRAAYLQNACCGDTRLQQRIEALLLSHEQADEFMQKPRAAVSAKTLLISTSQVVITEKPGDRIGRYKLLQQIGEGGCGLVYVAEQEEPVRRRVALKLIKLGMDTKSVVARFEAERQALALMDHPNIAKVLDAGATDTGRPYFVMELVRGIKITDYCDQNNLCTEERLKLFILVCQAIQHAHQKGIIHRDIKPSNILVTLHDGVPVPKVIDFGIAKATTDQRLTDKTIYTAFEQFIGTPAYMSPEQAEMSGLDIDTRSDIYSLGVLFFELLTGSLPFDPQSLVKAGIEEIRRRIREEEPPRPSMRLGTLADADLTTVACHRRVEPLKLISVVRGDLDWIAMKALEKDRTRRYETANGLALDIQRYLGSEPVVAGPPSRTYRLRKMVRRNRVAFAAGAAIASSLVIGTAVCAWQAVRATHAERASRQALEQLRSTAPALVEQARVLASEECYEEAIDKLDYAAKLRPDVADYIVAKANLVQCQLRINEAANLYRAALRVSPEHVRAKANLALCEELGTDTGGKLSRENLTRLLESMQQERRPAAELLPVARLLGKENEFLVRTWMLRLKELPITPDRPLESRFALREGWLELDLSNTAVADLTPLRDLPLQVLDLGRSRVTSLEPIRGSRLGRSLRRIKFPFTGVTDVSPLRDCTNLEVLDIAVTQVSDLNPVRYLRLKELYAAYSALADLVPLCDMPLEKLIIGDCPRINDVRVPAKIRTLRDVIPPTGARNIESLRSLPQLDRIGFIFIDGVGPDKTAAEFWAEWDKKQLQTK